MQQIRTLSDHSTIRTPFLYHDTFSSTTPLSGHLLINQDTYSFIWQSSHQSGHILLYQDTFSLIRTPTPLSGNLLINQDTYSFIWQPFNQDTLQQTTTLSDQSEHLNLFQDTSHQSGHLLLNQDTSRQSGHLLLYQDTFSSIRTPTPLSGHLSSIRTPSQPVLKMYVTELTVNVCRHTPAVQHPRSSRVHSEHSNIVLSAHLQIREENGGLRARYGASLTGPGTWSY